MENYSRMSYEWDFRVESDRMEWRIKCSDLKRHVLNQFQHHFFPPQGRTARHFADILFAHASVNVILLQVISLREE